MLALKFFWFRFNKWLLDDKYSDKYKEENVQLWVRWSKELNFEWEHVSINMFYILIVLRIFVRFHCYKSKKKRICKKREETPILLTCLIWDHVLERECPFSWLSIKDIEFHFLPIIFRSEWWQKTKIQNNYKFPSHQWEIRYSWKLSLSVSQCAYLMNNNSLQ